MLLYEFYLFSGLGDVKFELSAYVFAIASVIAQSVYLTYVQKTGVESGVSALSVLHLNSINCIPFLFAFSTLSGNLVSAFNFQGNSDPHFVVSIFFYTYQNYWYIP